MNSFADKCQKMSYQSVIFNIFSSHAQDFKPLCVEFNGPLTCINIQMSEIWLDRDASMLIKSIRINVLTKN